MKHKLFMRSLYMAGIFIIVTMLFALPAAAQTEVMAWGNMTGIRIDGLLIDFESSVRIVNTKWANVDYTGRERQRPRYVRDGQMQIVKSKIQYISFEQIVTDVSKGVVNVSIECTSDSAVVQEGVFYCIDLPASHYGNGTVSIGGRKIALNKLTDISPAATAKDILIESPERNIKIGFASSVRAFVRKENGNAGTLYLQVFGNKTIKGHRLSLNFRINGSGKIDNTPAIIEVDKNNPGRLFAGFGGNFRLQNPANDPKVIDYCLKNMRVSFGRVEMPWGMWQPNEETDALQEALAGKVNPRITAAMDMAKRLAAEGMPVIISAWFPPNWALPAGPRPRMQGGVAAWRLDPAKTKQIYKSLADYLVYVKMAYGVEAWAFSFNESDLGINVLHTADEHAAFIKDFGSYLASRGLATKLLLGDNSDATTFDFIVPALNNPATHKYIAAVSFHSWRGCDDATLHRWAGAARELNVPILIGEGSTDAAAHTYPQVFAEPTFALYEINLYTRIAAICQPLSILQWQLTSDYSILWGDGIYGSTGELRPTQRFWNLKQLAATPENSFALPFTCDKTEVNCAAFGNISRGEFAVHITNNGGVRPATVKGLPTLAELKAYATNSSMSMKEIPATRNADGSISVDLPPAGFVSIFIK